MRLIHLTLPLIALAIHACAPVEEPVNLTTTAPITPAVETSKPQVTAIPTTATAKPVLVKPTIPKPVTPPAVSSQHRISPTYKQTAINGVTLSLVSFDDRDHHLRVADQKNGPGSRWSNARSAATSYNGLAAINAGFFTPEGKPLGILVDNGTRRGSLNSSSLGAGMIYSSPSNSSIFRKGNYSPSRHSSDNLLQTGPMLAEKNGTISGLSKTNSRHRSFIAWDGGHHWIIGYASPCTLHELSQAIAGKTLAGVKVHTAINLDGGRSSDLWVGNKVRNGGKSHRTFLNKTVRNYLVLVKS